MANKPQKIAKKKRKAKAEAEKRTRRAIEIAKSDIDRAAAAKVAETTAEVVSKAAEKAAEATASTATKAASEAAESAFEKAGKSVLDYIKENMADMPEDMQGAFKSAMKTADAIDNIVPKAAMIAGGVLALGTLAHIGVKALDKERENKQVARQRKNQKGRDDFDVDYYYELNRTLGLPQQLYDKRSGHSNAWGGKKY